VDRKKIATRIGDYDNRKRFEILGRKLKLADLLIQKEMYFSFRIPSAEKHIDFQ